MPSGYTSAVADGKIVTLEQFAWQCARGMGALIMMRDEPWDAPVPERFEPSTEYYDKAIAEAQAILDELPTLTRDECERRAAAEHEAREAQHAKWDAERDEQRVRYEAMIKATSEWECRAEGLKSFMLDQLRQSVDFDCRHYERAAEPLLSGEEWREATYKAADRRLGSATEDRAKEIVRTESRNQWLQDLRASLSSKEQPVGV